MEGSEKRPYDASQRRARAETERAATRQRVVQAARALFVDRGYAATTMADIAMEAGVALQSVYSAAQSKVDLLQRVVDLVVAGDDEDVMLLERPSFQSVVDELDPDRQVHMLAMQIAATMERLATVWVAYRDAAGVDVKAAEHLAAAHRRRHETFAGMVAMLPSDRLRHSVAMSTDATWAIGSIEVHLLLRVSQGWSADEYADWLSETLRRELLTPT